MLVTIFSSIENGIYVSICTSLALLLIRIARPRGSFLGKVTIHGNSSSPNDTREVFVPFKQNGIINSQLKIVPPAPGVIVYRFEESYLYPNSSLLNSTLVDYVKGNLRRGKDMSQVKLSDRPWNDPGPARGADPNAEQTENEKLPILRAIVLDFSVMYVFLVLSVDQTSSSALLQLSHRHHCCSVVD